MGDGGLFGQQLAQYRRDGSVQLGQRIRSSPKKSFIGYPSVHLLGQKVNTFSLTTDQEKLEAIRRLVFPFRLSALEHYLGLTGWL